MKMAIAKPAHRGARPSNAVALIKILFSLGLIWLFALALTRGLVGAPQADTVAIAPGGPIQRKIEWRPVADSHGYLLQLRDQNARLILERKLEVSRTTVELPPGDYRLRVASLNKFGKPASWSAWATLNLRRPGDAREASSERERNDSAEEPSGRQPADVDGANNPADPDDAASANEFDGPGLDWRIFIPGWSQYARGQTWRGLAWMTGFAGLGAAGYGFWQTGNNLALSAEAATPLLLLAPLSGQPAASLVLLQDRASARAAYDTAQANQRTIGVLAGVLYLLQIADALWLAPEASQNPAREASGVAALRFGEMQLSADLYAPGTAATRAFANQENEGVQFRFTKRF